MDVTRGPWACSASPACGRGLSPRRHILGKSSITPTRRHPLPDPPPQAGEGANRQCRRIVHDADANRSNEAGTLQALATAACRLSISMIGGWSGAAACFPASSGHFRYSLAIASNDTGGRTSVSLP